MKKTHIIYALGCMLMLASCKKDETNTYKVSGGSVASWKGYLETGYFNSGTIELQGEGFSLVNGNLTGGDIKIPLSSIAITNDLPPTAKAELTHHLQSADFFNMLVHPSVIYHVKSAEKMASTDAKGNNYLIKGELEILGKSLSLDILAKINIYKTIIHIDSDFKFDRTKWGMLYATDSTLPPDGKIRNEIEVKLDLNISKY